MTDNDPLNADRTLLSLHAKDQGKRQRLAMTLTVEAATSVGDHVHGRG